MFESIRLGSSRLGIIPFHSVPLGLCPVPFCPGRVDSVWFGSVRAG